MKNEKEARSKLIGRTMGDRIFDFVNTVLLLLLCAVTLYPMYFVICASFTKNTYLLTHQGSLFWPVGFNVGSYRLAFTHPLTGERIALESPLPEEVRALLAQEIAP